CCGRCARVGCTSSPCTTTRSARSPRSSSRTSGARARPGNWPRASRPRWMRRRALPGRRTTEQPRPKDSAVERNEFRSTAEGGASVNWLRFCSLFVAVLALDGCSSGKNKKAEESVVVYTSVDDVFARPICEQFEKETGIKVKLVPDTEETKSTGLLNRLITEK